MTKKILAVLDYCILPIISQMAQTKLLSDFINEENIKISFYTLETPITLTSQSVLKNKLDENPEIQGFVFYSLIQFSYGKKTNIELIKDILDKGYEIYIYRENIKLKTLNDLKKNRKKITLFSPNNIDLISKLKSFI